MEHPTFLSQLLYNLELYSGFITPKESYRNIVPGNTSVDVLKARANREWLETLAVTYASFEMYPESWNALKLSNATEDVQQEFINNFKLKLDGVTAHCHLLDIKWDMCLDIGRLDELTETHVKMFVEELKIVFIDNSICPHYVACTGGWWTAFYRMCVKNNLYDLYVYLCKLEVNESDRWTYLVNQRAQNYVGHEDCNPDVCKAYVDGDPKR